MWEGSEAYIGNISHERVAKPLFSMRQSQEVLRAEYWERDGI
jgi:hypothetical protein